MFRPSSSWIIDCTFILLLLVSYHGGVVALSGRFMEEEPEDTRLSTGGIVGLVIGSIVLCCMACIGSEIASRDEAVDKDENPTSQVTSTETA